jgi:hypothetical protein
VKFGPIVFEATSLRVITAGDLHCKKPEPLMSALGHKRTLRHLRPMSALPPKADMVQHDRDVRFVPKADVSLTAGAPATTALLSQKAMTMHA